MQRLLKKPARVNRPIATDLMLSEGKTRASCQAILQFRLRKNWRLLASVAMR
jgi:hypothetical protein